MNRGIWYYLMIPAIMMACLFQSTAATRIEIRGVKPDLVLLLIVVGTLIYGSRSGILWAFIGGLGLDIFSGGPMGASSLALIAAALIAGLGHRTLSRYNLFVPIGATAMGTLVYGFAYMAILIVLQYLEVASHRLPFGPTTQFVVVPAMLYNTTIMLFAMPFLNRVPERQDI